jgi:ABC-type lipoprotein export system ATPase subunit
VSIVADRLNEAPLVNVRRLTHIYHTPKEELVALRDLNLQLATGERIAVVGPSGSGKTTLLNILAALDRPREGSVWVGGRDLAGLSEQERDEYRRTQIGYAMQRVELGVWPQLTADENVQLPMVGVLASGRARRDRAGELLEAVGLGERVTRVPDQLAYGERRRLALAVALANHPRLLLADEVTAGLDDDAADQLLSDLNDLLHDLGTSAIIVAHGRHLPRRVDRIVPLPYARPTAASASTRRRSQADGRLPVGTSPRRDVLLVDSASRWLNGPQGRVEVLREVSLKVREGEMVAILGISGTGKSTLLAMCGGLDEPDAGHVTIAGQRLTGLRGEPREALLQRTLGWVMDARPPGQVTPTESVRLAARISGASPTESDRLSVVALAATGLEERAHAPHWQLSGGEQARVAVARALVRFPALVIADEPTAQLDILTSTDIVELLREAADSGIAVLLATHYPVLAEIADRVLVLREGRLTELRR